MWSWRKLDELASDALPGTQRKWTKFWVVVAFGLAELVGLALLLAMGYLLLR